MPSARIKYIFPKESESVKLYQGIVNRKKIEEESSFMVSSVGNHFAKERLVNFIGSMY